MSGFRILILSMFFGAVPAQDHTVYIAQVGHGAGFETTLSFVGLTNTTTNVLIETFDENGDPVALLNRPDVVTTIGASIGVPIGSGGAADSYGIEVPPMGTREVQSLNENETMTQVGYAKVTSESPVGVEVVFRNFANGVRITTTSVLPESPTMAFSMLAYQRSGMDVEPTDVERTGLALLNPAENGGMAEVTATLFDGAGRVVAEIIIPLAAGSKVVGFLDEPKFFGPMAVPDDILGSVEINSTQPVVPVVIKLEGSALVTQTVQPAR